MNDMLTWSVLMNSDAYHSFTDHLQTNLDADARVVGLVALGSMARQGRQPDGWSDHDFFVITVPGVQEEFRSNPGWLPDSERIVLHARETAHGLKVLYDDGHLLEFAVFDDQELSLARVNDYRVLFDKADISKRMSSIAAASAQASYDEGRGFSLFLSLLLVGAGRVARGEVLSGHRFIKDFALAELLALLSRRLPSGDKTRLDNLDPFRRFEQVFPEAGAQINAALLQEPLQAARSLLDLADAALRDHLPGYPAQAVQVIYQYLEQARGSN